MNALKRTQGMTVKEMGAQLGMSYMGVKGVCGELLRRGLLETWREPRPQSVAGRPRLVYRLTTRAHDLYPAATSSLTQELLQSSRKLFGPSAPEKLLMTVWHERTETLSSRMTGATLAERAESLTRLRDADGHMAVAEKPGLIVEHHCPFIDVLRTYPLVAKLETDLFSKVLGTPVERGEHCAGGLYRAEFKFEVK